MTHPAHTQRNLGLDLIRATAILLVLLSHFSDLAAVFTGRAVTIWLSIAGMFGVELFFVLSGFLIGGILLRMIRTRPGWRDWLVFMLRRWLRTLPLYLLWVAALALLLPSAAPGYLWRYLTLTQNLFWPMPADNWFGVSWSLTVEEWFYLTFSTALLGAAALTRWHGTAWAVIGAFIAAPLAIRLLTPAGPDFMDTSYKIAALRLDAIAYGVALVRLNPARLGGRLSALALAAGLGLLGFVWVQACAAPVPIPQRISFPLLPTAIAIGCALLFPAALKLQAGRLKGARGLLAAAIRQLSAQSYSLYLVHLSLLDSMWGLIQRHHLPPAAAAPLALALTFAVSWLLWRCIERPILARRPTRIGARAADHVPVS